MEPVSSIDVYCDGASRGNPGRAAVGIVFVDRSSGDILDRTSRTIGEATNNLAEYTAIKLGLEAAYETYGASKVRVYSDSQLVIRQLTHEYRVNNDTLSSLLDDVEVLAERFDMVSYREVPRNHPQIQLADAAANSALEVLAA